MYTATICKLNNLKKHPNADKLLMGYALGHNVIVGLDITEDTLGIVFPSDGKLSPDMLMNNNLYRKNPLTGELMGGFFEQNGRVKTVRLRGAASEAFWTPLSALSWAGDIVSLEKEYNKLQAKGELLQLDTFNGHLICEKYYTPKTISMMSGGKVNKATKANYAPDFAKHGETPKLRDIVNFIQGAEHDFIVTEKLHGTSGRTGLVRWTKRSWLQNILYKIGLYKDKYRYVTGTRNVTLNPDEMNKPETGFYAGSDFRAKIHNSIMETGLRQGEILYYEIVGYSGENSLIMGEHPLDKNALKESGVPEKELSKYGDTMRYTYGTEQGKYDVYVYRITQDGVDLFWNDLVVRCAELDLKTVPFMDILHIKETDTVEDIMLKVEPYTQGQDVLDARHIREGVVLREEFETGIKAYKYKGFIFCLLEGICKNTDEYIDLEEVS